MFKRFTCENLYKTRLASDLDPISTSGDQLTVFTIEVEESPVSTSGWVILDFTDSDNRDLIFYHDNVDGVLSYYRKDRDLLGTGAISVTHEEGSFVQMNDVAQLINYLFDNTNDFGRIEDMGDNYVRILGGEIDYGSGTVVTIADTSPETLDDGTYYGVFDTSDGALKFILVTDYVHGTHILLGLVTVVATDISSIVDKRYKEFFQNRNVLDDLSDSGGNLTYKGVPLGGGAGTGDVIGPASAVDGNIVLFDTASGKVIKDSGKSLNNIIPDRTRVDILDGIEYEATQNGIVIASALQSSRSYSSRLIGYIGELTADTEIARAWTCSENSNITIRPTAFISFPVAVGEKYRIEKYAEGGSLTLIASFTPISG